MKNKRKIIYIIFIVSFLLQFVASTFERLTFFAIVFLSTITTALYLFFTSKLWFEIKSIFVNNPTPEKDIKKDDEKKVIKDNREIPNNVLKPRKKEAVDCDYITFDFETSGLSKNTREIIEIGAAKIKDGQIVDTFDTLVKPKKEVDPEALKVNKINLDELEKAPESEIVLPLFQDFIKNYTIIGYNSTNFDLPILKSYVNEVKNEHKDVFYISKSKIQNVPNYKLTTIASYLLVDTSNCHRALDDAIITHKCYEKLLALPDIKPKEETKTKKFHTQFSSQTIALQELQAIISSIVSDGKISNKEMDYLSEWLDKNKSLKGNYPYDNIAETVKKVIKDGVIDDAEQKELIELFSLFTSSDNLTTSNLCENCENKVFVLTGDFEYGSRAEVFKYIENQGGICKNGITKSTDYLIIGAKGSPNWGYGNYGRKIKTAKEYIDKGVSISIISENDFFSDM